MATSTKPIGGWFFLILGISAISASIAIGLFAPQWVSVVASIVGVQQVNMWPFWIASSVLITALSWAISFSIFNSARRNKSSQTSSATGQSKKPISQELVDPYKEIINDCQRYIDERYPDDALSEFQLAAKQQLIGDIFETLKRKLNSELSGINISSDDDIGAIEQRIIDEFRQEHRSKISNIFKDATEVTSLNIDPELSSKESFDQYKERALQWNLAKLETKNRNKDAAEQHIKNLEGRGNLLIEGTGDLIMLRSLNTLLLILRNYLQPKPLDSEVRKTAKGSIKTLLSALELSEEQMEELNTLVMDFQSIGQFYQNLASDLSSRLSDQEKREKYPETGAAASSAESQRSPSLQQAEDSASSPRVGAQGRGVLAPSAAHPTSQHEIFPQSAAAQQLTPTSQAPAGSQLLAERTSESPKAHAQASAPKAANRESVRAAPIGNNAEQFLKNLESRPIPQTITTAPSTPAVDAVDNEPAKPAAEQAPRRRLPRGKNGQRIFPSEAQRQDQATGIFSAPNSPASEDLPDLPKIKQLMAQQHLQQKVPPQAEGQAIIEAARQAALAAGQATDKAVEGVSDKLEEATKPTSTISASPEKQKGVATPLSSQVEVSSAQGEAAASATPRV